MKINVLLWNIEELKSTLQLSHNKLLNKEDIHPNTNLCYSPNRYSQFLHWTRPGNARTRKKPKWGNSFYYKLTTGKIKITYQDKDTIVLNSERITMIGLYIEPLNPNRRHMTALTQMIPGNNIIKVGDLNCRSLSRIFDRFQTWVMKKQW